MAEAPIAHLKSFPRLMMESPCPFSCKSASALEIYKRFFKHGCGKIRQHLINCSLRRWGPFGGIIFSFLALCVDDKCDKYISPVTATVCSYDLNRLTVFTRTISWGGGRSAVMTTYIGRGYTILAIITRNTGGGGKISLGLIKNVNRTSLDSIEVNNDIDNN